jgi:formate/nitrite transporter FocA (FNT family)
VSSVLEVFTSIVGNIEVLELLHSNTITLLDYLAFLSLAIVGNAIGGAVVDFQVQNFEST